MLDNIFFLILIQWHIELLFFKYQDNDILNRLGLTIKFATWIMRLLQQYRKQIKINYKGQFIIHQMLKDIIKKIIKLKGDKKTT